MGGSRRDTQIGVPVQRVVDIAPAARLAGPLIASAEFDFDLGPEVSRVLKGVGIGEQKGHFFSRFCGRLQTPSGLTNHGCKTLGHAWNYLGRDFVLNRFPELFIELLPLRVGKILIGQVTLAGKPEGGTIQRDVDVFGESMDQPEDLRERSPALEAHLGTPWREKRWRSVQQPRNLFQSPRWWNCGGWRSLRGRLSAHPPQVWQKCPFKCHDTIRLRIGCAHAGAAGSRRLISDFTVAGSFSEIAVAGISFAPFGPKPLTA
jgi:hypothetical protein